jgi:mannose/fructose-specific phosphotransferase system component IIA
MKSEDKLFCVIVCHGEVADALMGAVEGILGQQGGWFSVSNSGRSIDSLVSELEKALSELPGADVFVFTDLAGGSCYNSCRQLKLEGKDLTIISGVNLPILLEFFLHRESSDATRMKELLGLKCTRCMKIEEKGGNTVASPSGQS